MNKWLVVVVDFAFVLINLLLYVSAGHHWWSLAAALFCGLCGFYVLSLPNY